jgi:hypothetical protein
MRASAVGSVQRRAFDEVMMNLEGYAEQPAPFGPCKHSQYRKLNRPLDLLATNPPPRTLGLEGGIIVRQRRRTPDHRSDRLRGN